MSIYADLKPLWEGAADRLRAKVDAATGPVLEVDPLDYWAAIAEGLPDAEWGADKQFTLRGVRVVVDA